MSRKKTQPKKKVIPDPKFNSTIIPKLINNIMYDGKRGDYSAAGAFSCSSFFNSSNLSLSSF